MTVKKTADEIVVTLPASVHIEAAELERFLKYLRYKELVANSNVSQSQIDALAASVNKSWWQNNKHRFLPDICD